MSYECIFGGAWVLIFNIRVEVFGYLSMFIIVLKDLFYFCIFLDKNGPLEGHVPNFPSGCINTSLNSCLLCPHIRQFSFEYAGENSLDICKDMDCYCWTVCLWKKIHCFGSLWWWKLFPKFLFTIASVMVEECAASISTFFVYRVSNTSSVVNLNVLESSCICGLCSNSLYFSSSEVI